MKMKKPNAVCLVKNVMTLKLANFILLFPLDFMVFISYLVLTDSLSFNVLSIH